LYPKFSLERILVDLLGQTRLVDSTKRVLIWLKQICIEKRMVGLDDKYR